ncbi:IclR family transcriptional regulator [Cellulosimicrobium funkei]|nr:IclR family transcriptional regulator [Cellulosimicrobium funkei]
MQSLDRAVEILRCFGVKRTQLGITEIARSTGLSTSTVHRLLASMAANGLVHRGPDHRYSLGPLIVQLARSGAIPTSLREVAMPLIQQLRDEVNETAAIHELLSSGMRAVVAQAESRQELRRTYTDIGNPLPLPLGAPGKAILAHLPAERQDWWISQGVAPELTNAPFDAVVMRNDLAATRERGWAQSNEERTPGIRTVAAPVFDETGAVIGAISLSVPVVRMGDERVVTLGARVAAAAKEASDRICG